MLQDTGSMLFSLLDTLVLSSSITAVNDAVYKYVVQNGRSAFRMISKVVELSVLIPCPNSTSVFKPYILTQSNLKICNPDFTHT